MNGRPEIGLALGGGFLRGAAHVGALKVLVEEGVPVRAVAGTSAGSIAAALFAAGYSPEKMKEITLKLKPSDLFDGTGAIRNVLLMTLGTALGRFCPFSCSVPAGVLRGNRLERTVDRVMGGKRHFSQLKNIILAVTAVNVRNGTLVVFMPEKSGVKAYSQQTVIPPEDMEYISGVPVSEAVRASCSVPGLFEPKKIKGRVLVDGGVRDNIPASVLKKIGMDVVLAVDVGYDGQEMHKAGTFTEVLTQSYDILASESMLMKLDKYADLVIRPEIKGMFMWDFDRIGYAIEQGEEKAREMLPEIRRAIGY